jgi:CRISPR-associated endonuclease/helicase Cas3
VLWDDDAGRVPSRWAAEHATRYLAAAIAVGTVDQAMLSALQVKHAHLRGSALSRSLLVIDEVHASDAYMRHVQKEMLKAHMALGGHGLLMSATLGSVARADWRHEPQPNEKAARAIPYPTVWVAGEATPRVIAENCQEKAVQVTAHPTMAAQAAAQLAIEAAQRGARVLVVRNTVQAAIEIWRKVQDMAPALLLQVCNGPALHHSRFAAEDRRLLDRAIESVLGKAAGFGAQGCIVIGTQTLEQSLDIDADFLITDLCPMDVLLQRIGRLHRHLRNRPEGFATPRTVVLCPEDGLAPLSQRQENGLGAFDNNGTLSGIYVDLAGLEATHRLIKQKPNWRIPAMNRELVEAATHPDALARIADDMCWQAYQRRVTGQALAQAGMAERVILDRSAPFPETYPEEERIKTRIGEEGVVVTISGTPVGPFGQTISRIALPAHWSYGLTGEEAAVAEVLEDGLKLTIGERAFRYGRCGLERA